MPPPAARVLIVEDNRPLAENIAEILDAHGYAAEIVETAEQALVLLAKERFDGVVTDFRLPGISGAELIHELRCRGETVPVVVVSAFADVEDVERAEAAGALDVLAKPVDFDRLFEILAEFGRTEDRVLVVEDSEALAGNIAELLRERRLQPIVAATVEAALSQRHLPKVAIVDFRLPDGTGFDAIRRLQARDPTMRVLLTTGYPDDLSSNDLGGIEHPILEKPVEPNTLVARVEAVRSKWHGSKR